MLKFDPHMLDHVAAYSGGLIGAGGALAVTAMPDGSPVDVAHLAGYGVSLLIGLAPVIARRFLFGGAAGDRTRATQKRARAAKLPEGSADRRKLEDDADELDAKAAEKEAAGKG